MPITYDSLDKSEVLYSFLRATHTADIYKICQSNEGDLFLAAEVPMAVVTSQLLEKLVRDSINIVDVSDQTLIEPETLKEHIKKLKFIRLMQSDIGFAHQLGLFYLAWAEKENVHDIWKIAIGQWAIVLTNKAYWKTYAQKRAKYYDQAVLPTHLETLEAVLEKNERRLFTFSEKSAIVF